jgi:hypothetical protein
MMAGLQRLQTGKMWCRGGWRLGQVPDARAGVQVIVLHHHRAVLNVLCMVSCRDRVLKAVPACLGTTAVYGI